MKHLLALIALISLISACKEASVKKQADGFEIDYFTKDFYTYINNSGWSLKRGGFIGEGLHFEVSHGDSLVEISIGYDQQAGRATSFEFSCPKGDPASELLLQEILSSIDGADNLVKVTNR